MLNRENNVSRAGNTSKHVGKQGNTVSTAFVFWMVSSGRCD